MAEENNLKVLPRIKGELAYLYEVSMTDYNGSGNLTRYIVACSIKEAFEKVEKFLALNKRRQVLDENGDEYTAGGYYVFKGIKQLGVLLPDRAVPFVLSS